MLSCWYRHVIVMALLSWYYFTAVVYIFPTNHILLPGQLRQVGWDERSGRDARRQECVWGGADDDPRGIEKIMKVFLTC